MIYLDHAATTRPYPEVASLFEKESLENFGNPNSTHGVGFSAKKDLEEARGKVLSLLGLSKTHQCIFLSGASEANSMAIKSVALAYQNRGKKLISDNVEHPSVTNALSQLQDHFGFSLATLPVNAEGVVTPEELRAALDKETVLVSLMAVNNETGAIFPTEALSKEIRAFPKALFHVDATQSIGKVDVPYQDADLISFSGHKFGGIKGTGCLIYKKSLHFLPLVSGGEQEFGYRGGTVSVAGAVSLAKALELTLQHENEVTSRVLHLDEVLEEGLRKIPEVKINSPKVHTPYITNFSLEEHKASVVVEALSEKGIYVSSVSACSSKGEPVSYVVSAMGGTPREAANTIRVSLGRENTEEDVQTFLKALNEILSEVKKL